MDPPKVPGEGLADHPAEHLSPHKPPQLWARHVPICISTAHPAGSSSSQISMTLTSQGSCKQLVMLVIVRVVCSEIKCHGAICVRICHDFHSCNYFRHAVNQQCNVQSQIMNISKPLVIAPERVERELVLQGCSVCVAAGQQHPPPGATADPTPQLPSSRIPLEFPPISSTGPDCEMPVAASVMKAKPGALCNLGSPRRKNKRMHNPPASVSR